MRLTSTLTTFALGVAIMTASYAGVNDFKFSTNQTAFQFNPSWYVGNFTYAGTTYGAGSTFNLTTLPLGYTKFIDASNTSNYKQYNFYRQNYSTVVANIQMSDRASYVKDIVGQNTVASTLPTTGTYNYTGKIFMQQDAMGDFNYQLNLATKKGKGSFSNLSVATDSIWAGTVKVSGDLSEQTLTTTNGVFGVNGATVNNFKTDKTSVNAVLSGVNVKYDIGVFGPNAEEVAGRVYGSAHMGGIINKDLNAAAGLAASR